MRAISLANGRDLRQVLAVTPTWAEHEAFTAELRAQLKVTGALGQGENLPESLWVSSP